MDPHNSACESSVNRCLIAAILHAHSRQVSASRCKQAEQGNYKALAAKHFGQNTFKSEHVGYCEGDSSQNAHKE
jgi:hypothetical protein